MIKLREQWPLEHNEAIVNDVKEVRTDPIVDGDVYMYECSALREVERRASLMPAAHTPCVIEGKEVQELMSYWTAWVDWARTAE